MRRVVLTVAAVVAGGLAFWWLRSEPRALEQAYVRGPSVTAWDRVAQVREAVATLRYGELVDVLERRGENARIRTAVGAVGWVAERNLMPAELWQKAAQLVERARAMPVQARGRTKVPSNIRTEPSRDAPRIIQLSSGTAVEVLARAVAEWKPATEEEPSHAAPSAPTVSGPAKKDSGPCREDWLLVRAREPEAGDVAGWVIARFLEPDLPNPLRDLGASIRWMAWFELSRVPDGIGQKGQFLGVGTIGPEGQACDFTLLRVYTWNAQRRRYETAYVQSNLCARLPVTVRRQPAETLFSFDQTGRRGTEHREYRFRQNIVRRVKAGGR